MNNKEIYKVENLCRICNSDNLEHIISLGDQPLANNLIRSEKDKYVSIPLSLYICKKCSSVQIVETVEPKILFEKYLYISSFSKALITSAEQLVPYLIEKYNITNENIILEIGSNDGYLLKQYIKRGNKVLGIEPAENIARIANDESNVPTVREYFNSDLAEKILFKYGKANVIHANNVLAHIKDIHSVINGIKILLNTEGILVAEVVYLNEMINSGSFDMIYHEHLFYYTINTFNYLMNMHGLEVFDVERIDLHGGSLRIYVSHKKCYEYSKRFVELSEQENNYDYYYHLKIFANKIETIKNELNTLLHELRKENKKIIAYGAPAKATVMFNYFGVNRDTIDYIVDKNIFKQGHLLPGVLIPVKDPSFLLEDRPDYIFISAWNLCDEIIKELDNLNLQGTKYILPLPKLKIIE